MTLVDICKTTPTKGKSKSVEKQLKEVTLKLCETESNMKMFNKMIKKGVATQDVYHFVRKQSNLRKSSNKLDHKLLKANMRQKLNDACAYATRLRQVKSKLRQSVKVKYSNNKSSASRILNE